MSQHVVKMSVELEVLKSSVENFKTILQGLKPDTKAFKDLNSIIQSMEKGIISVEAHFAKGFSSNTQIKATSKELDKVSTNLQRAANLTSQVKFSDLKLDGDVAEQYKNLTKELKDAQQAYSNLRKHMVQNTWNEGNNKDILKSLGLDPKLLHKSFEEIMTVLDEGVKKTSERATNLKDALKQVSNATSQVQKMQDKIDYGTASKMKDMLDQDVFKKFFAGGENGRALQFKGAKGRNIRQEFFDYLKEQFSVSEEQIAELKEKTTKQIEEAFTSSDFWERVKNGLQQTSNGMNAELIQVKGDQAGFQQLQQSFQAVGSKAQQAAERVQLCKNKLKGFEDGASSAVRGNEKVRDSLNAVSSQLQSYKTSLQQASTSILRFQQQQRTFESMKTAVMNFMGFYQVMNLVKRGIKDAGDQILKLDTVMNGIAVVTDMTTGDLWDQVDAYSALAQKYGVTTQGAYQVSKIYYQQGLQTKDVMTLTEETLKLAKISGLDYATTTDYMTTALRGFKMQMQEASTVVDVYSALAANTAVSQQQLAEAMTRTASSMESVGSTFQESSAMIATMVAVTRQSASNIGSALKSIASRYGQMKKSPAEILDAEGEALSFNKVDTALQSIGINMKTSENQFRSFTEVILQLSDKWNTLQSTEQRYIATQMAGNRQQSRFLALVSNSDLLRKNLAVAEESEGTGTQQALTTLDSLEAKINQVQTAYQQFYLNIGVQDVWKGFLDGARTVINTLNAFPKLFGKIPVAAILAITNVVSLLKTGLLTGLAGLSAAILPTLRQQMEIIKGEAAQSAQNTGSTVGRTMIQSMKQQLGIGTKNQAGQISQMIGSALNMASLFFNQNTRKGQKTSGGFNIAGGLAHGAAAIVSGISQNYPMMVMQAINAASSIITGVSQFIDTTQQRIARLTNEAQELKNKASQTKGEEKTLTNLKREYDELKQKQYDSAQSAQEFADKQNEIAEKFPELINAFDDLGNATIDEIGLSNTLADARRKSARAAVEAAEAQEKLAQNKKQKGLQDLADTIKRDTHFQSDARNAWGIAANLDSKQEVLTALGMTTYQASGLYSKYDIRNQADMAAIYPNAYRKQISGYFELQDDKKSGKNIQYLAEAQFLFDQAAKAFSNNPTEENLLKLAKEYNKVSALYDTFKPAQKEKLPYTKEILQQYGEELSKYNILDKDFQSSRQNTLVTKLQEQRLINEALYGQKSIWGKNGISSIISSRLLREFKDAKDIDADTFLTSIRDGANKTRQEELDLLQQQWKQLDDQTRKELSNRISNIESYSSIDEATEGLGEIGAILSDYIDAVIKNNVADVTERVTKFAGNKSATMKFSASKSALSQLLKSTNIDTVPQEHIFHDYVDMLAQIQEYSAASDIDKSSTAGQQLLNSVESLPSFLVNIIDNNGLLTVEGIKNSIAALDEAKQSGNLTPKQQEAVDNAREALDSLQGLLATNISLAIQAMGSNLFKNIEQQQKTMSKINKGMSGSEAQGVISKLNEWAKEANLQTIFSAQDLMLDASGNLVLSQEAYQNAMNIWFVHQEAELKEVQGTLDEAANVLVSKKQGTNEYQLKDAFQTTLNNILKPDFDMEQFLKDYGRALKSLLAGDFNKYFQEIEQGGKTILKPVEGFNDKRAEFSQALINAAQNAEDQVTDLSTILKLAQDGLTQASKWKKGDYSGVGGDIRELAKKNADQLTDQQKGAVKQYQAGLQSLLNDITSGMSSKDIAKKQYQGIKPVLKFRATWAVNHNTRQDFIRQYAQDLNLTYDQMNEQIYKARQADLEKTKPTESQKYKSAISKMQHFGKDNQFWFSEEQMKDLTNLFGKELGISDYTALYDDSNKKIIDGIEYYQLASDALIAKLSGNNDAQAQAIMANAANLQSMSNLIAKSYEGLNKDQVDSLNEMLAAYDIGIKAITEEISPGKYKITNLNEIKAKATQKNKVLGQAIERGINGNVDQIFSSALNSVNSIMKIQQSGTTNYSQMQGIVDIVNAYYKSLNQAESATVEGMFEYSQSLHGFVMTAESVITGIEALRAAMDSIDNKEAQQAMLDVARTGMIAAKNYQGFVETFKRQLGYDQVPDTIWQQEKGELVAALKAENFSAIPQVMLGYVDEFYTSTRNNLTAGLDALEKASQDYKLENKFDVSGWNQSTVQILKEWSTKQNSIVKEQAENTFSISLENASEESIRALSAQLGAAAGLDTFTSKARTDSIISNLNKQANGFAEFVGEIIGVIGEKAAYETRETLEDGFKLISEDSSIALFDSTTNRLTIDALKQLKHLQNSKYETSNTQESMENLFSALVAQGQFFEAYALYYDKEAENLNDAVTGVKSAYNTRYASQANEIFKNGIDGTIEAIFNVFESGKEAIIEVNQINKSLLTQLGYDTNQQSVTIHPNTQILTGLQHAIKDYYLDSNEARQNYLTRLDQIQAMDFNNFVSALQNKQMNYEDAYNFLEEILPATIQDLTSNVMGTYFEQDSVSGQYSVRDKWRSQLLSLAQTNSEYFKNYRQARELFYKNIYADLNKVDGEYLTQGLQQLIEHQGEEIQGQDYTGLFKAFKDFGFDIEQVDQGKFKVGEIEKSQILDLLQTRRDLTKQQRDTILKQVSIQNTEEIEALKPIFNILEDGIISEEEKLEHINWNTANLSQFEGRSISEVVKILTPFSGATYSQKFNDYIQKREKSTTQAKLYAQAQITRLATDRDKFIADTLRRSDQELSYTKDVLKQYFSDDQIDQLFIPISGNEVQSYSPNFPQLVQHVKDRQEFASAIQKYNDNEEKMQIQLLQYLYQAQSTSQDVIFKATPVLKQEADMLNTILMGMSGLTGLPMSQQQIPFKIGEGNEITASAKRSSAFLVLQNKSLSLSEKVKQAGQEKFFPINFAERQAEIYIAMLQASNKDLGTLTDLTDQLKTQFNQDEWKQIESELLTSTKKFKWQTISDRLKNLINDEQLTEDVKQRAQEVLDKTDPTKRLQSLFTDVAQNRTTVSDILEYYNQQIDNSKLALGEDDFYKENGQGQQRIKYTALKRLAEQTGLNNSQFYKQWQTETNDQVFGLIQQALSPNGQLDERQIEIVTDILKDYADGADFSSLKSGQNISYDMQQKLAAAYAKYYIDEAQNILGSAHEAAEFYLQNGLIDQFIDMAAKTTGKSEKATEVKEAIKGAITNGNISALNNYSDILGGYFTNELIQMVQNRTANAFSAVIQGIKQAQQSGAGHISIGDDHVLGQQLSTLSESLNGALEAVREGNKIVGYEVTDAAKGYEEVSNAIEKSNLTKRQKYSLKQQMSDIIPSLSKSVQSILSAGDSISELQLFDFATASGIDIDKDTQDYNDLINSYFKQVGQEWRFANAQAKRQFVMQQYQQGAIELKQANQALSEVDSQQREQSIESTMREVLLNYDNLSNELIERLATNLGWTTNELASWFQRDASGNWKGKQTVEQFYNANKGYIGEKDQEIQQVLNNQVKKRVDAFSQAMDTVAQSIGAGESKTIDTTDENKRVLQTLSTQFSDIIQTTDGGLSYTVSATANNVQQVLDVLSYLQGEGGESFRQATGIDSKQLQQMKDKIQQAINEQSFAHKLDQVINNYKSIPDAAMQALATAMGKSKEELGRKLSDGTWEMSLDNFAAIEEALSKAIPGLSEQERIKALTKIQDFKRGNATEVMLGQFIQNRDNITDEMVTNLAWATNSTVESIGSYLQDNGKGARKIDERQLFNLINDTGATFNGALLEMAQQSLLDFSNTINSLTGKITSGTTSASEMRATVTAINESQAAMGQFKQAGLSDIYEYNEATKSFVLTQAGISLEIQRWGQQLRKSESGDALALFQNQTKALSKDLADQVDFMSYFNADTEKGRKEAGIGLIRAVRNWNQAQMTIAEQQSKSLKNNNYAQKMIKATPIKQISDELLNSALSGNIQAIQRISKLIGRQFTFEDRQSIVNAQLDKISKASENLTSAIGTMVSDETASLLNYLSKGMVVSKDGVSRIAKQLQGQDLAAAYSKLYEFFLANNAPEDILNQTLIKSLEAGAAKEVSANDALSNAAEMSISDFANFLLQQGISVTTSNFRDLQEQFGATTEGMAAGKIRIVDLQKFAQQTGIDTSTREYLDAYKSLQDAIIEDNTYQKAAIKDELTSITEAKVGDQLNLSYLYNKRGELTTKALQAAGATRKQLDDFVQDGVLAITENIDLLQFAENLGEQLANEPDSVISQADLAEIRQAIAQGILDFIGQIATAITSGLDETGRANLIKDAKKYIPQATGISLSEDDFFKTAQGFKLTTSKAIDLYSAMRDVEGLKANEAFEALSEQLFGSARGLNTISGLMNKMHQLQKKINDAKKQSNNLNEEDPQKKVLDNNIQSMENQLNLYNEIANKQRATNSSAYDFMGNSLPQLYKGAVSYGESWLSAFEAINNAYGGTQGKVSGIDPQAFYNIAKEANDIAGMTGKAIPIFGTTLTGNQQILNDLLEKGFSTNKWVQGQGYILTLEGLIDWQQGAAGLSSQLFDGIEEMVQLQHEINVQEGNLYQGIYDFGKNMQKYGLGMAGILKESNIFNNGNIAQGFTKNFDNYREATLNAADSNKEIKDNLQNISLTIGGTSQSLYKWLKTEASQLPELGITANQFTSGMAGILQAISFNDYNIQELFSAQNLQAFADMGLNLEYALAATGQTFSTHNGKYALGKKSSTGSGIEVNGARYAGWDDYWANYTKQQASSILQGIAKSNSETNTNIAKMAGSEALEIAVGGISYKISAAENGGFTVEGTAGQDGDYKDWNSAKKALVDDYITRLGDEGQQKTTGQAEIELGLKTVSTATAAQVTSEQMAKLARNNLKTWDDVVKAYSENQSAFKDLYGFAPGQSNQNEINQFAQNMDQLTKLGEFTATIKVEDFTGQGFDNGVLALHATMIIDGFETPDGKQYQFEDGKLQEVGTSAMEASEGAKSAAEQLSESMTSSSGGISIYANDNNKQSFLYQPNRAFDLNNRPIISAQQMKAAGYTDFADDYATLYSSNWSANNMSVLATPIQANGTVLSDDELANYVTGILESSSTLAQAFSKDNLGLLIGGIEGSSNKIDQALAKYGQELHNQQAAMYDQRVAQQSTNKSSTGGKEPTASTTTSGGNVVQQAQKAASVIQASMKVSAKNANASLKAYDDQGNLIQEISNASSQAISEVNDKASETANDVNQSMQAVSDKTIDVSVNVSVSVSAAPGLEASASSSAGATGNVALATGFNNALVGQLGPELVVSHGRYYMVGQNGAQFVNLDKDAIIFNHLQTQRLLSNGHTGRGKAVTNQTNATSFAKGNVSGYAFKDGSITDAADAGRVSGATWQASGISRPSNGPVVSDMPDPDDYKKETAQVKAVVEEIDRWYNLLRQIADLQQKISYHESLQAKIQSDRRANGKALYNSYVREIELLDQQIIRQQTLLALQEDWYQKRREEFVQSEFGKIFTYDKDTGILQYQDGINMGLDVLQKLTKSDVYGKLQMSPDNAAKQLTYLRSIGFDLSKLMYNNDGTVVENAEQILNNPRGFVVGIGAEENYKVYQALMKNFFQQMNKVKDQLDGLHDEIGDQRQSIIDAQNSINEKLQAIIDNQLSVQQDVLNAIESREQKLIDELQDERDALEDSTKRYVDGLNDQLKEQRQMYKNEQTEKQLVKLRRQLSILQRSGGSGAQIRSLQDQIAAKQQDQYFTLQEQQIAAVQKASDLQIERLDSQIKLMTETLEYQKQNGLLWQEVYAVMAGTPQQIRQFITENTPDFQSASALDVAEKIRDIDLRVTEWAAARDKKLTQSPAREQSPFYDWDSYVQSRKGVFEAIQDEDLKAKAQEEFERVFAETSDINAAGKAANDILTPAWQKIMGENAQLPEYQEIPDPFRVTEEMINARRKGPNVSWGVNYSKSSTDDQKKLMNDLDALKIELDDGVPGSWPYKDLAEEYNKKRDKLTTANKKNYRKYKQGGLVTTTGLVQVDGTPSRPQAFLNAQQTQLLRDHLFGSSNSLLSLARDIVQQLHVASYNSDTSQQEGYGINIQNVDVNVNVKQIANDYDVRSIGNSVMDEMLKIARKSGTRGLSRR